MPHSVPGATDITLFSLARAGVGCPSLSVPERFKTPAPSLGLRPLRTSRSRYAPKKNSAPPTPSCKRAKWRSRKTCGLQRSLAPKSLAWDNMSVDAFYHPVHSIGGDFALVNSIDREHVSLLVCDVSGHGISSALVANRIYSEACVHMRSGMPFLD